MIDLQFVFVCLFCALVFTQYWLLWVWSNESFCPCEWIRIHLCYSLFVFAKVGWLSYCSILSKNLNINNHSIIIIIYTGYKNILNDHIWFDQKERNKKNIWLADQLHFRVWDQLLRSRTLARACTLLIFRWCQPTVFLVSFLFGRIIVTYFI